MTRIRQHKIIAWLVFWRGSSRGSTAMWQNRSQ